MYLANTNQKNARVAVLISGIADFRTRKMIRNKEGHYIMIRRLIPQEDITILNIYTLNKQY